MVSPTGGIVPNIYKWRRSRKCGRRRSHKEHAMSQTSKIRGLDETIRFDIALSPI
jgi:hypothetical protein